MNTGGSVLQSQWLALCPVLASSHSACLCSGLCSRQGPAGQGAANAAGRQACLLLAADALSHGLLSVVQGLAGELGISAMPTFQVWSCESGSWKKVMLCIIPPFAQSAAHQSVLCP